jgi:tRNA pseudouridine38-40 synthase
VPDFRLTLEYDGTDFAGWQVQRGARTVQGVLEDALARVSGAQARVVGAGRTDAGVHAEGQGASVRLETRLAPAALGRALNAVLPPDVVVRELVRAPDGFHARRDARRKLYRYAIWNGPVRSPLRARFAVSIPAPLDVAAMRQAARALVGTHVFASFQAAGSRVRSSERTLVRLDVEGTPGGAIEIFAEGTGFLRHMVRNLVGTLLRVGRGGDPCAMAGILAARRRAAAGPTAPAEGLTLVRVEY